MTSCALQVAELLQAIDGQLTTAESCTGGLIAECITQIPGSSEWYVGGWVTYSNAMKSSQLGVEQELIETHGAVSWQVSMAMCEGAIQNSGATASVSTTGIAGPTGGTEDKPVGQFLLVVALATRRTSEGFVFQGVDLIFAHKQLQLLSK